MLTEQQKALIADLQESLEAIRDDYIGNGHLSVHGLAVLKKLVAALEASDQPPQLSESDEELLQEAREGGKEFRVTQSDWELWIVDLKNRLALRVEQLAAERDHLWELNELGKRCVSEGALAVELLLKLLEEAPSSEPPS
jgi:hypothetical protein